MAVCPKCGNKTGEGAVFCDRCGTPLPKAEPATPQAAPAPASGSVICPGCGAGNVPGEAFCDFCGSPLEAPVPAAATATATEVAQAVEEPAGALPAEATLTCPACGAKAMPGEAFCADCGASLAQPPMPPETVPEPAPEPVVPVAPPEAVATAVPPEPAPPVEPHPAVEAVAPTPPPAPVPVAVPTCPACGAEVEPVDRFCSNCGAVLTPAQAQAAAPAPAEPVMAPPPPSAGPRLVVVASGAEILLAAKDELLVGREDPVSGVFPDVDLTPHGGEDGGVSRRHAHILIEGGNYFIEDLNSTNSTSVNKQRLTPRTRQPLKDGDEIRFGRVALILKI